MCRGLIEQEVGMKDLFSLVGKALLWIIILALSLIGPIMWLLADIGIWKKILSIFGIG